MYGYLQGYSETDSIEYCPKCGKPIHVGYADGTVQCTNKECRLRFGVIEKDDDREA